MFKGLTQRAQKVLTILAQEEAKRFHSDQLLPEHIILALLKDGEGVAVKALEDQGKHPQSPRSRRVFPRARGASSSAMCRRPSADRRFSRIPRKKPETWATSTSGQSTSSLLP